MFHRDVWSDKTTGTFGVNASALAIRSMFRTMTLPKFKGM
jgi:hypothetical protein